MPMVRIIKRLFILQTCTFLLTLPLSNFEIYGQFNFMEPTRNVHRLMPG